MHTRNLRSAYSLYSLLLRGRELNYFLARMFSQPRLIQLLENSLHLRQPKLRGRVQSHRVSWLGLITKVAQLKIKPESHGVSSMCKAVRVSATVAVLFALATLAPLVNAQTDNVLTGLDVVQDAELSRGTVKVRSWFFNPFNPSQTSHLTVDSFGLPARTERFSVFASPFGDPLDSQSAARSAGTGASTTSPSPVVVTPIAGGQATLVSSPSHGHTHPWVRRPTRSPYRAP